jgi:hypothetical protein
MSFAYRDDTCLTPNGHLNDKSSDLTDDVPGSSVLLAHYSEDLTSWFDGRQWFAVVHVPNSTNLPLGSLADRAASLLERPTPGLRTALSACLVITSVIFGGISLVGLIAVSSGSFDPSTLPFLGICFILFGLSLASTIAVSLQRRPAKLLTIITGIALCLTCVGAVLGIPILITASRATNLSRRGGSPTVRLANDVFHLPARRITRPVLLVGYIFLAAVGTALVWAINHYLPTGALHVLGYYFVLLITLIFVANFVVGRPYAMAIAVQPAMLRWLNQRFIYEDVSRDDVSHLQRCNFRGTGGRTYRGIWLVNRVGRAVTRLGSRISPERLSDAASLPFVDSRLVLTNQASLESHLPGSGSTLAFNRLTNWGIPIVSGVGAIAIEFLLTHRPGA